MIAVDTNVLVYAHRTEMGAHEIALRWLRHLAAGKISWALPVFCLAEFLRVTTHPRLFSPPTALPQAVAAVEALVRCPSLHVLSPGSSYARLFLEEVRAADAHGNLVFDAQIAAVCKEHGVNRLLTFDRDFARFPHLRIVSPGDAPESIA